MSVDGSPPSLSGYQRSCLFQCWSSGLGHRFLFAVTGSAKPQEWRRAFLLRVRTSSAFPVWALVFLLLTVMSSLLPLYLPYWPLGSRLNSLPRPVATSNSITPSSEDGDPDAVPEAADAVKPAAAAAEPALVPEPAAAAATVSAAPATAGGSAAAAATSAPAAPSPRHALRHLHIFRDS